MIGLETSAAGHPDAVLKHPQSCTTSQGSMEMYSTSTKPTGQTRSNNRRKFSDLKLHD